MPGVKPYLIGQAGISDLSSSYTIGSSSVSASSVYPEIAGGAGLDFSLGDASKIGIIVQSKVAIVLGNGGTFTYLPVVAGVSFKFQFQKSDSSPLFQMEKGALLFREQPVFFSEGDPFHRRPSLCRLKFQAVIPLGKGVR